MHQNRGERGACIDMLNKFMLFCSVPNCESASVTGLHLSSPQGDRNPREAIQQGQGCA